MIGLAQALKHQIAKAGTNGHADAERPGKDADSNGNTGDDGQVGSPVMTEASIRQGRGSHGYARR